MGIHKTRNWRELSNRAPVWLYSHHKGDIEKATMYMNMRKAFQEFYMHFSIEHQNNVEHFTAHFLWINTVKRKFVALCPYSICFVKWLVSQALRIIMAQFNEVNYSFIWHFKLLCLFITVLQQYILELVT